MANRSDDYDGAWIQGGTARIAARGEPGGGPIEIDDTPPELKEHMKREENKDTWSFRSETLARLYGDHYTPFAEARKTMSLGDAKGFTERSLTVFDADVLATAKSAPSDEARQRFVDDAMDLRGALETQFAITEGTFTDMRRRSDLGLKAGALARQAQAYPEDYALHAAVLNKVADGAQPLVTRERIIQFRRFEAEKMARGAMMGFIEQGRFDEGRALLATATDADGNPGTLPLPPDAVKELGAMLEERHAAAAAREERLDRVDTVIEGTAGPTDDPAEWRDLVEEHFEVAGPQMAELEPAERIGAEDDYVRKLGHLPKPLTRSLRAGMLSGEPGQEAAAALRLKLFADHDPALIEAIPETERARAAAIAEFAELGLKPERAVELGEKKLAQIVAEVELRLPTIDTDDGVLVGGTGSDEGRVGIPEAPGGDFLQGPEDEIGDQRDPMVYNPGYVWENGRWRLETPEERREKLQPLSAEEEGGPMADGGEAGGEPIDGDESASGDEEEGDSVEAEKEKPDEANLPAQVRPMVSPLPRNGSSEPKNFDDMIERLKPREGRGFTDDPDDPGGPTKHGIIEETLKDYHASKGGKADGFPDDVRDLTPEQAKQIYLEMYYERYRNDEIQDPRASEHAFDICVNPGPYWAALWFQEALNKAGLPVEVDGTLGSSTLDALNRATPEQLRAVNNAVAAKREEYYRTRAEEEPKKKKYLGGWLARAGSFIE